MSQLPFSLCRGTGWALPLALAVACSVTGPESRIRAGDKAEPARDRHGDPLPLGARARLGSIHFRHGALINAVALAPDGKTIATGGRDRSVRIWDLATAKLLHKLVGHTNYVQTVAFSPDGRTLASGGLDGVIVLWDTASGKERQRLKTTTFHRAVYAVALSPDGKRLASGAEDGRIRLWDVRTGAELEHLVGHRGSVCGLVFSADGKVLASGAQDQTVRLWYLPKSKEFRTIEARRKGSFTAMLSPVALSPDGTVVAVAYAHEAPVLADVDSGKVLHTLPQNTGAIYSLALSPDGKTLATGGYGDSLRLYEVATGKETADLGSSRGVVHSLTFARDGKTLAWAEDNSVRLWDVVAGKERDQGPDHSHQAKCLAYAADGKLVATGSMDGTVRLWEPATGKVLRRLDGIAGGVRALALSPDGKVLAGGGDGAAIRLWNTATGAVVGKLMGKDAAVYALAFSPDGKTLAVGTSDRRIRRWDWVQGKERDPLGLHLRGGIHSLAFSPDGKVLASRGGDSMIRVWETSTGQQINHFAGEAGLANGLAFSPDGRTLAAAYAGKVLLWETALGRKLGAVDLQAIVSSLAFSPDGKILAVGGSDGRVHLYEAPGGKARAVAAGHEGTVWGLAFSVDGKRLVSTSSDGTGLVWDVDRILRGLAVAAPADITPVAVPAGRKPLVRLGGGGLNHGGQVRVLAFSANGTTLLSAGSDPFVRLWDIAGKTEIRTFASHPGPITYAAFAARDRTLCTADQGTARLWETVTGKPTVFLDKDRGMGFPFAITPDGSVLVSASRQRAGDNTICLWQMATGRLLHRLEGHQGKVLSLAISPNGKTLASGGLDETIRVWDLASGKPLQKLTGHEKGVNLLVYSPDGKTLASYGFEAVVRLWETDTGKNFRMFRAILGFGRALAFSPDSRILALGAGTVQLWDVTTGKSVAQWRCHNAHISAVAFAPDGETLATAGLGGPIRLWELPRGTEIDKPTGHQEEVSRVFFAPDGRTLVTSSVDNTIRVWNIATGRTQRRIDVFANRGQCVALSPGGEWVASRQKDGILRLWDTATGTEVRRFPSREASDQASAVAFAPAGTLMAVGRRKAVTVYQWPSGKQLLQLEGNAAPAVRLGFSLDGTLLAAARVDGRVTLHDVATGRTRHTLASPNAGSDWFLAFSPDGRTLAAGSGSTVRLWEVATSAVRAGLGGVAVSHGNVRCAAFSPDGTLLAAGGDDRTIRFWDLATGRVVDEIHQRGTVTHLAWSTDGKRLATASSDGTALVWDASAVRPRPGPKVPMVDLSRADLERLWLDLSDRVAATAYAAMRGLRAHPQQAVPLLQQRLRPVVSDPKHLARLLADLAGDDFAVREQATEDLARLGRLAEPLLRQALTKNPSAEVQQRVKKLLETRAQDEYAGRPLTAEQLAALRGVEFLEHLASPEARQCLEQLARGAPQAYLTEQARKALARLAKAP